MSDSLAMYVVYRSPSDYPGEYVVREWEIDAKGGKAGVLVARAPSLEAARRIIAEAFPGLVMLPRQPGDDPVIVETWL